MRLIYAFIFRSGGCLLLCSLLMLSCSKPKEVEHSSKLSTKCSEKFREDDIDLSIVLDPVADQISTKSGVYVLEDGGGSLVTRAWLSEYAEQTIDIQYFIFSTDNVGLIACDYLVRAANRGVKVRILLDDIMVEGRLEDLLTMDSHENISIKIYNPGVNLGKNIFGKIKSFAKDFRAANQRMHNKTFTVDQKVVVTGGRNIADEYFDYDHDYNFRDRDVLLMGKVVRQVKTSFDDFWSSEFSVPVAQLVKDYSHSSAANRFDNLHRYACDPDNFWPEIRTRIKSFPQALKQLMDQGEIRWIDSVAFISDLPGKNDGTKGLGGGGATTTALMNLINSAQESIEIQTPYLITTDLGKSLFKKTSERGVRIRILTNSLASTDNVEAFSSYQTDRQALLETGVSIFEFKPDAAERTRLMTGALQKKLNFKPVFGLHAKTMVIDQEIVVIGTFNLDPRSANLNTECISIIYDPDITRSVLRGIEKEFLTENAWEITKDFNPDKEVSRTKRFKTWTRKVLPKAIL